MTLSSIFRSSRNHNRFFVKTKQLTCTSSVLQLPEILTIIFSFLNQYTLKNTIRFVCKNWLAICRQHICIHGLWKDRVGANYSHDYLLDRLHQVTDLRVVFEQYYGLDEALPKWDMLLKKIDALSDTNKLHITKLVFSNAKFMKQMMYTLLPKVRTLTEIQMHRVVDFEVHLGLILNSCPNLRWISIGHGNSRESFKIQDNIAPSDTATQPTLKESRVESIILKGGHVESVTMVAILSRCPRLMVLKMVEVVQARSMTEPIDRSGFFAKIAMTCPKLKHFHFSIQDQSMNIEDAQVLSRMFSSRANSSASATPGQHVQQKSQTSQHHLSLDLDTISVLDKDIKYDIANSLFAPTLDPSFNNFITTLEILRARDRMHNAYISRALHMFLCAAPSLLHLLAPTVPYFAEYLDLQGPTFDGGYYYPRSCAPARLITNTHFLKKEIWACRRLRTLQIKFISRDISDHAGAENARIMFGYISTVCPNLRELAIDRKELKLNLEGGLCFLSRLRYLQRLTILTWTKTKLEKRDLDWMARRPVGEVNLGINGRVCLDPNGVISFGITFTGKCSDEGVNDNKTPDREPTVEDIKNIGSAAHLKKCLSQLQRDIYDEGCWPMLEFLGLKLLLLYKGELADPDDHLPAMIAEIRPGLEFSCNYSEW
ncbi:hypothetical protein BGX27_007812 [Mortierella sp. AM989]|nr:hypothetical protein BGX27_007812 [Mortierella sp. AM989]